MIARFVRPALSLVEDPLPTRKAAESRLEQLHDAMLAIIEALDLMDGDPDLEPSIDPGRNRDGSLSLDDREGGDVLDEGEPHDWDDEAQRRR